MRKVLFICSPVLFLIFGIAPAGQLLPGWADAVTETEVFAAETGQCGDALSWTLNDEGILTISGTGDMWDYDGGDNKSPFNWNPIIQNVVIENGVTGIGRYAFLYCTNLTNISLPDSLARINAMSLFGTNLTQIRIPKRVTHVSTEAVPDSLESFIVDDENTNYASVDGILFSKDKTQLRRYPDGKPGADYTLPGDVTWVDYSALRSPNLANIYVGDGNAKYLSIDGVLFYNGDYGRTLAQYPTGNNRASYTIPDGTVLIQESAFLFADNLTDVIIPEGVTGIGNYAFDMCTNLENITIPRNVTSIGAGALPAYAAGLTVYCYEGSQAHEYAQTNGIPFALLNDSGTDMDINGQLGDNLTWTLNKTTGLLRISGVGDMDFSGGNPWAAHLSSIRNLIIDDGVTDIKQAGFDGGYGDLSGLTIGNSVCEIGDRAFWDCDMLTSVDIPDSVIHIGLGAFYSCDNLTDLRIGENVQDIGGSAFQFCYNLESLTIPDSVTSIGGHAFYNCGVTRLSIGSGLTEIGEFAFAFSTIVELYIDISNVSDGYFGLCLGFGLSDNWNTLTFGPNIQTIADDALFNVGFSNGRVLYCFENTVAHQYARERGIPYKLLDSESEDRAISGKCGDNLTYTLDDKIGLLTIGGTGDMWDDMRWVKDSDIDIGGYSGERENIKTVVIHEGATSIGASAFSYTGITNIVIPNSVRSIGHSAFSDCLQLETAHIGSGVADMGGSVFRDCAKLTEVIVSEGVSLIGNAMFSGCSDLRGLTLPSTLKSIGSYAFSQCTSLTNIPIPSDVTSIGAGAFSGSGITGISIPDSVTSFGSGYFDNGVYYSSSSIFENCASLTDVNIGNGVTDIGFGNGSDNKLFAGCTNLRNVTIGNGVQSLNGAFHDCANLQTVVLGSGIQNIDTWDFRGCYSLTSITIPDGIKKYIPTADSYDPFEGSPNATIRCHLFKVSKLPEFEYTEAYRYAIQKQHPVDLIGIGTFNGKADTGKMIFDWVLNTDTGRLDVQGYHYIFTDDLSKKPSSDWTAVQWRGFFNVDLTFRPSGDIDALAPYVKTLYSDKPVYGNVFENLRELTIDFEPDISPFTFSTTKELSREVRDLISNGFIYDYSIYNFSNCKNLSKVTLNNHGFFSQSTLSQNRIGGSAFADCASLTYIKIDPCFGYISPTAFTGAGNVTIHCYEKSAAHVFADNNGIPFVLIDGGDTGGSEDSGGSGDTGGSGSDNSDNISEPLTEKTLKFYSADREISVDVNWGDALFDDASSVYNAELALISSVLSMAAYNHPNVNQGSGDVKKRYGYYIEDAYRKLGFADEKIKLFRYPGHPKNQTNYSGIVASDDDFAFAIADKQISINGRTYNLIIVTLRGTSGIADWFHNLLGNFESRDFLQTKVHSGFYDYFQGVNNALNQYLEINGLKDASKNKFLITGHSLGAAGSNLLAAYLTNKETVAVKNNIYCYTFATPNLVMQKGLQAYNCNNIFNTVNARDNVTGLPARIIESWDILGVKYGTAWKYGVVCALPCDERVTSAYKAYEREFTSALAKLMGNDISDLSFTEKYTTEKAKFLPGLHYPEFYVAWMSAKTPVFTETSPGIYRAYKGKVSINCPVDVEVYDADEMLVGRITDNVVDNDIISNLVLYMDGDAKYVILPDGKYRFKLTGTDNGLMNFAIEYLYATDDEIFVEKTFNNVQLFAGKQMASEIGGDIDVSDALLFVLNGQGKQIAEIAENGTETPLTNNSGGTGNGTNAGGISPGYASYPASENGGEGNAAPTIWANPFDDVKESDWFFGDVKYVCENKLFNGTSATAFDPTAPMTRAMLATVLYRLAGEPAAAGGAAFLDVPPGQWFSEAVAWASANGIVAGYGAGVFGTNDNITREQIAVMLRRYAKNAGHDVSATVDLSAYADAGALSEWAREAAAWANAAGLLTGRDAATLAPAESATRAEVAAVLHRFAASAAQAQ
jgi:hypothetical protein